MKPSYRIIDDARAIGGKTIQCGLCGGISCHPMDVANRFCGACRWHHDMTPVAIEDYRFARKWTVLSAIIAAANWIFLGSMMIFIPSGLSYLMALLSFVAGGMSATLAWSCAKRLIILRPFGRFT